MKYHIYILAGLFSLFACKQETTVSVSTERLGYTITGTSEGNGYVYLQKYDADNGLSIIDSALIDKGQFIIKGNANHLEPHQLVINEDVYPIVLENTTYELIDGAIKGTSLQNQYNAYYEGLKTTENPFVYQRNFINSHPESMLSAVVLKTMLGTTQWRINQNKLAYNSLEETIKNSYLGKEIHEFITTHDKDIVANRDVASVDIPKKTIEIKSVEPKKDIVKPKPKPKKKVTKKSEPVVYKGVDFEADDLEGNNFVLSDITTRSKYVLIDFWASWCAPCRKQNPYLVEVYNMYHDKGFDIVSVSEDRSKLAWQKAVEADGLRWHHVIDDFNRLTNLYNIESIPHTILINGKGEIIASDISPYILKTKLGGLLRQ